MSNEALKLLSDIQQQYNASFKNNNIVVFNKEDFISKYNNIDDLLLELSNFGYIDYWITGNFVLKED